MSDKELEVSKEITCPSCNYTSTEHHILYLNNTHIQYRTDKAINPLALFRLNVCSGCGIVFTDEFKTSYNSIDREKVLDKSIITRNGYTILIMETNTPKIVFFNKDKKVVFELNAFIEDFTDGNEFIPIKIHQDFHHINIHPIKGEIQENLDDWIKKRYEI
jgi:hypothetical protein